jgi:hypothetical protein
VQIGAASDIGESGEREAAVTTFSNKGLETLPIEGT